MSIELIDKIKPKNNGTFSLVDACDVEMPDGSRLDEAMDTRTSTTIPNDGVLKVGILYFFGEVETLSFGIPDTARPGDMFYFSFSSGTVPTELDIRGDNIKGLDGFETDANSTYEIMGMWNGIEWLIVSHEVA